MGGGKNGLSTYNNELEGQFDFLKTYIPRVDRNLDISNIQNDYSDGVIKGNILEFKLHIDDLNSTLFQTIKYLSSMRIKGKFIPENILLISLNTHTAYLYHSSDYLEYIERVYTGGASKENSGFLCGKAADRFDYSTDSGEEAMISILRSNKYAKIHIDENCIVGWASTYYRMFPNARKSDIIGDYTGKTRIVGEIRKPDKFKDYIYPYEKESNERFRYLMDRLNDSLQKQNLGAFYTHELYAKKSLELVREAIKRVPEGNDYVIIDRCAGTGNLELHMTDEELSHVIVSTLEYYEYKVLMEVLGDKVRHIIPPTEKDDTFNMGLVRGADALSKEYVENEVIQSYIGNPNVTIILFENPPFAETTSAEHQRKGQGKASSMWKRSYVVEEMKKEVKGTASNDLGNAFIWSGFKYYLRQPTDSYIVYSPVKYWKAQLLIDRRFVSGFAFNRRHFHTKIDACIMCAYWSNEQGTESEIEISAFDIEPVSGSLIPCGSLPVKQIFSNYSEKYYDKRRIPSEQRIGILAGLNGTEKVGGKQTNKPATSPEIMGYMVAHSSGFDNPDLDSSLLVAARYDGHGFFLRKDNYLEKLPMFAASRYITYNRCWTERARIMKSADGADRFFSDVKNGKLHPFLLKCLLFTVLEPQNHMRSFTGSDGRKYVNQLCLDNSNGETIASRDLKDMKKNERENILLEQWNKILADARSTNNYDPQITYGLYQIKVELNTTHRDEETNEIIYDYPNLNGNIKALAELVKSYYNEEIVPLLFEYQLLK